MAQKKISDLTAHAGLVSTDLYEVETAAGVSVKVTGTQLAAFCNAVLTAGASSGMNTFLEVENAIAALTAGASASMNTFAEIEAVINAILAGASAGMNTFLEVETALALKAADPANPLTAPFMSDEFDFASTESGEIGQMGWGFTNGTFGLVNPEANHPGICRRTSTAVSGTIASFYSGGGGGAPVYRFDQLDEQSWILKPLAITTDHDLRFGWCSDLTDDTPTNGFYFERLAADTTWFAVSRQNDAQTRTAMNAIVADWTKLKLRRVSAAAVAFSINGGAETQIATNIPLATNALAFGGQVIPRSAAAQSVDIDFYSHKLLAQTR